MAAVDGQVQEAFLDARGHVLDEVHGRLRIPGRGAAGGGPEPFAVFPDVQVKAVGGEAHRVVRLVGEVAGGLDGDGRGVRPEQDGDAGRAADLQVLPLGEALVPHRVHAVVGVGRVDDLADEGEVGGLGIDLGGQGGGNEDRQGGEDELFHGRSRLFPQKYA